MDDESADMSILNCPSCGQEISVALSAGTNRYACPLCGNAFAVDARASEGANESLQEVPKPPSPMHSRTRKTSGGLAAIITIIVVAVAVGLGGFLMSQTPAGKPVVVVAQDAWPVATQSGHTIDDVTVRVLSVSVGPVRAKNADGTVFVSDREDYWMVRLRVHNGGEKPIEFQSWHAVEFPGATPANAILKDDDGNAFVMQQFEDVAVLQGQTLKKSLAPRKSTLDVIVFEAPEGFDREKLKELRLELPGAACQIQGVFRQVIPKTLVE